jgi:hypothetical protein
MFGQMRSRSHEVEDKPCVCKDQCPCHHPQKENIFPWLCPVAFPLLFPGSLLLIVWWVSANAGPRYIQVQGETCEIHYVQTGVSSTGASRGYEEVICPSWKLAPISH